MREAYRRVRGWQEVANHYGMSKAAAYRIVNDPGYRPSAAMLDAIIDKDVPPHKRYEVPACPDCGLVHTGRCNGHEVAEVVVLAPGQKVVNGNGTPKRTKRINITVHPETRDLLAAAKPAGETWDEWLRRLIDGR